jgi:hypothetical protein
VPLRELLVLARLPPDMRIALVDADTHEWRSTGPAETERLRALAEGLAARGHDVTVFCTQFWKGCRERLRQESVTYRAVTVAPARGSFAMRLPALLAVAAPDVVHARPTPASAVLAADAGATLARAPLVVRAAARRPWSPPYRYHP